MFYWFEPVLYLDPVAKFSETTEKSEFFVGFADNVGDALTFKILKNDVSSSTEVLLDQELIQHAGIKEPH
jgi:hypothetical protein